MKSMYVIVRLKHVRGRTALLKTVNDNAQSMGATEKKFVFRGAEKVFQ